MMVVDYGSKTETAKKNRKAYNEGEQARRDNKTLADNPYQRGDQARTAWEHGYKFGELKS